MAKTLAKGTQFQLGNGASPEVFTAVVQLTKVPTPKRTRAKVDVTDHDSTTSMEYIAAALHDLDELEMEGNWAPTAATHGTSSGVAKWFNDGTIKNVKVILPASLRTFAFPAFCSRSPSFDGDFSSKLGFNFAIQPTGPVVES